MVVLVACSNDTQLESNVEPNLETQLEFILEDKTVVYDGDSHSLIFEDLNIDVTYINNTHIDSGVYEVEAYFNYNDEDYFRSATLTILPFEIEASINTFDIIENTSYNFEVDVLIKTDYEITYYYNDKEINKPNTAGFYKVKVSFYNYDDNYIINDIYSEFNINLNDYEQSLIDAAILEDKEVLYDGNTHRLVLSNSKDLLNQRYIVNYFYNESFDLPKEKGTYEVRVTITKNTVVVKELTATLVIV